MDPLVRKTQKKLDLGYKLNGQILNEASLLKINLNSFVYVVHKMIHIP